MHKRPHIVFWRTSKKNNFSKVVDTTSTLQNPVASLYTSPTHTLEKEIMATLPLTIASDNKISWNKPSQGGKGSLQ